MFWVIYHCRVLANLPSLLTTFTTNIHLTCTRVLQYIDIFRPTIVLRVYEQQRYFITLHCYINFITFAKEVVFCLSMFAC